MNTEIEYKFLVDLEVWNALEKPTPDLIVQAYLHRDPEKTIRVRIKGDTGYLTIKGKTVGVTRPEFEYRIPKHEAEGLIETFQLASLRKYRYRIPVGEHIWDVDVFSGTLEGLIVAEIELKSEDEAFEKPEWATEDVSKDPNYYNAVLIDRC